MRKLHFQRFLRHQNGNVGMMFAIVLVPVMLSFGMAVDYSLANSAHTKLMQCADSAALAAVGKTGIGDSKSDAEARIRAAFADMCSPTRLSQVTVESLDVAVSDADGARSVRVGFQARRKNEFLTVGGFPATQLSGTITSASAKKTFVDVYALLDNSPSMGLAATIDGQRRLKSLTSDNCAFGCHQVGAADDNYRIARRNNVSMRIDVLREAWKDFIVQAQRTTNANQFRFATYTANLTMNQIQPLTGSYPIALSSADAVDLMPVPQGMGATRINEAVSSLNTIVTSSGDGSTVQSSKKYVLFVTDGVQDIDGNGLHGHITSPFDPSTCAALKTKGVNVAVIYTTFIPMPDQTYKDLVAPFASTIGPNLRACASNDLYFEASQTDDIKDAFNKIFAKILASARLTS